MFFNFDLLNIFMVPFACSVPIALVMDLATQLNIELLFLPAYSPTRI
jgi:hypothetical protein